MAVDAYVGLGSNQGDSVAFVTEAVEALADVVAASSLYATEPIGGPDQARFVNAVAHLHTASTPYELLAACQAAEVAAGRVRDVRWGPRTLDVDVLLYGDMVLDDPELTIPHPRMYERRFVLEPLAELAPGLVSAEQLAAVASQDCVRIGAAT